MVGLIVRSAAAIDDVNLPWLLAGEIQLPHLLVSALQVAGKAWRVEQRFGVRRSCDSFFLIAASSPGLRARRTASPSYSARLAGNKFRQADCRQQAGSDPRGEMPALKRDQRNLRPQRVARRGVAVADARIQEQVRQCQTSEVFGLWVFRPPRSDVGASCAVPVRRLWSRRSAVRIDPSESPRAPSPFGKRFPFGKGHRHPSCRTSSAHKKEGRHAAAPRKPRQLEP